jgi:glutathione synthase/RimK-type ligase-like ATP-grasp enzyme
MRIGVVNRFPAGPYPLGDALEARGFHVIPVELAHCALDAVGELVGPHIDGVEAFLWRLSENIATATKPLSLALEKLAPVINSTATRDVCSDKWATYRTLAQAGVPVLETMWLAPGAQVPHLADRTIVKPAGGAGARDVRIVASDDRIDAATRES